MLTETDEPTRQRVARSILVNGPSTAAALAERLDLTPAAVRRHLDQLLAEGAVAARDPRPAGARGRGRPAKVFALTERGRDAFDQQYDDLAAEALRFLAETAGDDAVRAFAERRAAFIERRFPEVAAAHPGASPAEVLALVFSDEGYAASVRELPVIGEQLCQQHCPVSHVAHEFPQLCEAETEAIGRVLGTHVQRLATIAHGDGVCTTCIPVSTGSTGGGSTGGGGVSTGSTNGGGVSTGSTGGGGGVSTGSTNGGGGVSTGSTSGGSTGGAGSTSRTCNTTSTTEKKEQVTS